MQHYISDKELEREFQSYIKLKAKAYSFSDERSIHHYLRGVADGYKDWLEQFGVDVSSERTDPLVIAEIERLEKK